MRDEPRRRYRCVSPVFLECWTIDTGSPPFDLLKRCSHMPLPVGRLGTGSAHGWLGAAPAWASGGNVTGGSVMARTRPTGSSAPLGARLADAVADCGPGKASVALIA